MNKKPKAEELHDELQGTSKMATGKYQKLDQEQDQRTSILSMKKNQESE